ncbi:MAG: TonB-dependent receptor [Alistipes sp.]|nr:TonB-dependent receptor [Alistipes sp.]
MKNNFTMKRARRGKSSVRFFLSGQWLISLVCCTALCSVTAASAQQRTYDVNYDNRTIISVLDDLKARTGYLFLHQDGVISDGERVSARMTGATLGQILDRVLTEQGYRYRIDGNDVIITRAPAVAAAAEPPKPRTVTGTVTNSQDQPLAGVSVLVKGQLRGTVTGADGNYSLDLVPGQVLEFSFLGLETVEVAVTNQTVVNVRLEESATQIEQAIVIGYGSARRLGSVVGSVSTIGNDKLKNTPTANFSDALQGQVAGLSVLSDSGEPAATASIRLRGVNTMMMVNEPLFILDGSPVSSVVFNSMNPSDIENIVVLKDASSTAIYGSRAANGVIAITSKKGRMNEDATVTLKAQYGISQLAGDKITMMNSEQYFRFREMMNPDLLNQADWLSHKNVILDNGISTDWAKYIFRDNAPTYNVDASITGGGAKMNYYISMNHHNVDGIAPTSEWNRTTLRSNVEAQVKEWLRVGVNANMAYMKYNENPDVDAISTLNPAAFARFARPDDSPYYYTVDNDGVATFGDRADYLHESKMLNPRFIEDLRHRNRQNVSLMVNMFEEIRPVNGLILRAVQSLDSFDYTYSSNVPPVADFTTPMGDQVIYNNGEGQAREVFQRYYSFTFTNTLEYKLPIRNRHRATVLLGQESIITKNTSYDVTFTGHNDKRLMLLSNSTDYLAPSHSISERVFNSAFVRLDYGFDNKYYLDLTYRVDGSSRFGPNNRWAEFYSVGAKWDLKREDFLARTAWVNDLGLRLSYGTTGNAGIPDYLYFGLVGSGNLVYEGENGTTNIQAGNPNLSWETVATLNVGVDFSLFDRVTGTVEFYRKKTSDMLMYIPYSYTTGYGTGVGNIGGMTNTGLDFMVNVDVLRSRDFLWSVRANGNYNKNRITELFNGLDEYVIAETGLKLEVGKPYGEFFIVRRKEIDPRDGKQIWLDKYGNETKVYNEEDAVFVGKQRYAPFSGGFGTLLQYKNLSLNADFVFALGKYALNNDMYFFENAYDFGTNYNQSTRMLDMWTTPGQRTNIPAATEQIYADDHLLENASFMRLKTLQLTYSLPERWLKKTNFFRRMSVFAVGRNLFTVTKYSGFDPEPDDNVIQFNYPNTRQYVFGLELTF